MEANKSVFAEMEKLSKEIVYYADQYFNHDNTLIANYIYDEKVKRLDELREDNPELADMFTVQDKPVPIHEPTGANLKLVDFTVPMLGLKKASTFKDIEAFNSKHPVEESYCDEYKLDGLALEMLYQKKDSSCLELVSITTRGSGLVGEDVTHALPMFRNLPKKLRAVKNAPTELRVRGEAYLSIFDFESYNEIAVKKKTTPRNAASGFIRSHEKNMDRNAFGLIDFNIYWSDCHFDCTEYSALRLAWERLGFYTAPIASLMDMKHNKMLRNIPTDGIVRKINSLAKQVELGVGTRYPNWGIAYKFPNEEKETLPASIDWQVGKTGRVVPVVNYNAIKLGGVTCDRASLDNVYQFLSLDLRPDTVIIISRNGDVIPRLHRVSVPGKKEPFKAPTECPSCNSVLETRKGKNSADLICTNVTGCPGQLLMRCVALVGKRCLDVEDLGPVKLGQLIDCGIINTTSDVFWSLSEQHVGQKVLDRIEAAKYQPWHVVIKALGFPGVDLTRAKKLADALPETVMNRQVPQSTVLDFLGDPANVMSIPGFSTGLALPIAAMLKQEEFNANARDILRYLSATTAETTVPLYKGVITGSLGQTREELEEYFGENGIEIVDNLTKDCQFLLIGEKPGKSKVLKATELGIPMVESTKVSSIEKLVETIKGLLQ